MSAVSGVAVVRSWQFLAFTHLTVALLFPSIAVLPQPFLEPVRRQDADAFVAPSLVVTPQPPESPATAMQVSSSDLPLPLSLAEPHSMIAPALSQPDTEPRPSRPSNPAPSRPVASRSLS